LTAGATFGDDAADVEFSTEEAVDLMGDDSAPCSGRPIRDELALCNAGKALSDC